MATFGDRMMAHFAYDSPWTFTSSAGISAGLAIVGANGGSLYLENSDSGDKRTLYYFGVGASFGPLPMSGSFSTPEMWSKGLGKIRGAKRSLTFNDLRGPMCILSGSLAAGILPDGASGSVFFLGFPVGLALLGGAIEIILSGLLTATAYGAIVGHFKGIDAGVSLLPGYAR